MGGPGFALREDGEMLASHFSSTEGFSRGDLGFIDGRDWSKKREVYDRETPGGYDLVWITDPKNDARWQAAMEKNREAAAREESAE
jgi:hypothetical protein